ncbi:uncharacterized protein ACR2FA_005193 [Aphomia sociella]
MSRSGIPSPSRSQGRITPRRYKSRGTRSVGSPARSNTSERLTSIIQFNEKNLNSFVLSPIPNRRSLLTDNTDIEEPRRKSWWKKLNENTTDVMELMANNNIVERNNVVEGYIDVEVLSQEKKNYTLDLPESSDNESINSIVIPHRKLFTQKENQPHNKFGQLIENRESLAKLHKTNTNIDKSINVGPKNLFGQGSKQRTKIVFPAALLTISPNKTANKTKELAPAEVKGQARNLFGNRAGTKRKNMFADFIVSESEDEIPEIQPRVFGFPKKTDQIPPRRGSSSSRGLRDPSPTSSITTDIEMDDWKLLPSSTMVENQLEDMMACGRTPVKKARLSKFSEEKESETKSNSTANKTKSNKSLSSQNKSKNSENLKSDDNEKCVSHKSKISSENIDTDAQEQPQNKSQYKDTTNTILNKSVSLKSKTINKEILDQSTNKSKNTTKNKSLVKHASSNLNINQTQTLNKSQEKQLSNNEKEEENLLPEEEKINNITRQSNKTYHNQSQMFATKSVPQDDVNTDNILERSDKHSTSKKRLNNSQGSNLHKQNNISLPQDINQVLNETLSGVSIKSIDKRVEQKTNITPDKIISKYHLNSIKKTSATRIDEIIAAEEPLKQQNYIRSQNEMNEIIDKDNIALDNKEENAANKSIVIGNVELDAEKVKGQHRDDIIEDEIDMNIQDIQSQSNHAENINNDVDSPKINNNVEHKNQEVDNDQEMKMECKNDQDITPEVEDHDQNIRPQVEDDSQDINDDNRDISEEVEDSNQDLTEEEEESNQDISEDVDSNQEVNAEVEDDSQDENEKIKEDSQADNEEIENDYQDDKEVENELENDLDISKVSEEVEDNDQDDNEELENSQNDNKDVEDDIEKDLSKVSTEVEDDDQDDNEELENDQDDNEHDIEKDTSEEQVNIQNEIQEVDDDQNEAHEADEDDQEVSHDVEDEMENESQGEHESEEIEEENEEEHEDHVLHYESEEEQNDNHDQDMVSDQEEENEDEPEHISETEQETPNNTQDTTESNKSRDATTEKSPEVILSNKTNHVESFTAQGRNTTVRMTKSMIRPLNIKPSLAPLRESTGLSDGTKNSSAEGSGWDSHRTTRKTLRQTFGRDFTPRKSLRTLVMEKSAKRHTVFKDANIENIPTADEDMSDSPNHEYDDDMQEESTHEISKRTRQTTLEMYLQKIKKQNMEKKKKMEEAVRNSVKVPTRDILNPFKVPPRPNFTMRRANIKPVQKKQKTKPLKSPLIPLDDLPSELLEDMKYKPPRRFQPRNASWITMRLYKFLEAKLEPKYDYKTRLRSEKLVETIYNFTRDIRRHHVAPTDAVDVLKHEMARLEVVKTHFEFYQFFHEFMPREIRVKVNPDVVNGIPTPRQGIFSDILRSNTVQG